LEYKGKPILGKGRYSLLKNIKKTSSLKQSAGLLGISYKTAYNYINRIERRLGRKIIESHKGGIGAGGYTKLRPLGQQLLEEYRKLEDCT